MKRKGLGKGKGKGYKNIIGKDKKVHSDSAKGRKQPQSERGIHPMPKKLKKINWNSVVFEYQDMLRNYGETQDTFDWVKKSNNGDFELMAYEYQDMLRNYGETKDTFNRIKKQSIKREDNLMPKQRNTLTMMRVPYGNAKTPLHLREYQLGFGSPVGTIKEYETFFEGQNVKLELGLTMAEKKKVTKMAKLKDSDGDGVADILDCRPLDKNKQDDGFTSIDEFEASATKKSFGKSVGAGVKGIAHRLKDLGSQGVSYISELNKANKEKKAKFKAEVANLNNKQLEDLAVRYQDDSLFGIRNPYEDEIIRRKEERYRIKRRLKEAEKKAKERETNGGFF